MRKRAKWLVFLTAVLLAAVPILSGSLVAAEDTAGQSTLKGKIQALVWRDTDGNGTFIVSGVYTEGELIDDIEVKLYKKVGDSWIYVSSKRTGEGGYTEFFAPYSFEHGWVGWDDLEITDPGGFNYYKLEIVTDEEVVGSKEREASLYLWNNYSARFLQADSGSGEAAFRLADKPAKPQPLPQPEIRNLGMVQALVWDDINKDGKFIEPNGQFSVEELIDDITVNLYRNVGGNWEFVASAKTGPGGYTPFWYPHGWVGFKDLPIAWDFVTTIQYKLELVTDKTFKVIGDPVRAVPLNVSNAWSLRYFEVAPDSADRAFLIQSTSVSISGTVWYDANADQVREWHEPACAGWTVVITDCFNRKIATAKTDAGGYYRIRGLKGGTIYKVWITAQSGWKQVYPYYKLLTIPPWGCEKGHHTIRAEAGKYYINKDFGMLSMEGSSWATLYYVLWWVGLLQYQFQ